MAQINPLLASPVPPLLFEFRTPPTGEAVTRTSREADGMAGASDVRSGGWALPERLLCGAAHSRGRVKGRRIPFLHGATEREEAPQAPTNECRPRGALSDQGGPRDLTAECAGGGGVAPPRVSY